MLWELDIKWTFPVILEFQQKLQRPKRIRYQVLSCPKAKARLLQDCLILLPSAHDPLPDYFRAWEALKLKGAWKGVQDVKTQRGETEASPGAKWNSFSGAICSTWHVRVRGTHRLTLDSQLNNLKLRGCTWVWQGRKCFSRSRAPAYFLWVREGPWRLNLGVVYIFVLQEAVPQRAFQQERGNHSRERLPMTLEV